ncbi:MAG TPA: anhydro-N-acetylmuramic acid kinase [Candidatus Baltobacteraceae bacterium]|nr:anhydro-N-acetylmuramic acid kinase [Candidatus Baltobacteraceae bacterium]
MKAIGLMSGTSLDGIDAALVEIVPQGSRYTIDLLRFVTVPFDAELRRALVAALPPNEGSVALVAALHHALGEALAAAAATIAGGEHVAFVASHGQTVWHDGDRHVTLQLGDAFVIREAVKATVCYDFRSADCAAGGHGAPLVPYVDELLFGDANEDRVALNIGGIANVTILPRDESAWAFDTGPGVMLVDAFVRERTRGASGYDAGGALAARGAIDQPLLEAMLADEYFNLPPPKTTGRERFGPQFLARHGDRLARLSLEDGAATLTELTAITVAHAIEAAGMAEARTLASGGGAHNATLFARLSERLPHGRVERSDAMGVPADAKEAMFFALLGYETLRGRVANLPRATGADRAVPLGAIAPFELESLLAAIERELRAGATA